MNGLCHVSVSAPGIRRLRCGRGFRYTYSDGRPVREADTLERIRRLAIPPAYRDVWICQQANGHLQATGRDARGRKQYRYHPDWVTARKKQNFSHILRFGRALPRLRRKVSQDLVLPGMPREKVLALVVAVMGHTLARVGNDAYARSNHSFGLTTLRNRHLDRLPEGGLALCFEGKSGQRQCHRLDDPRLVRLLKRCRELPGQQLFQYRDQDGQVCQLGSADVNDYLRQATGDAFTAKDFRTWGGTMAAMLALSRLALPLQPSQAMLKKIEVSVVKSVARVLGNTPAVCRSSYIDPRVFIAWRNGRLEPMGHVRGTRALEQAAMRILRATRV